MKNMSNRTSSAAHGHADQRGESIGHIIPKTCLACGKRKKAGQSHPKCSRILQGMSQRGEI